MSALDGRAVSAVDRAATSGGASSDAIYQMVVRGLQKCGQRGGVLLDVGCGKGDLYPHVCGYVDEYVGADVIRYESFPPETRFLRLDLDAGRVPLPDASVEIVAAVETVEHLENPRAFFRELRRLVKPGGWVFVTTPNQLSLLSKLTLLTKNHFNAFQEAPGLYPTHITALLEIDLLRLAREVGFQEMFLEYSHRGRIPFTAQRWPRAFGLGGRMFSDNLLLAARAPAQDPAGVDPTLPP